MIEENLDDKQASDLPEDGAAEEKKSGLEGALEFETDKMSGAALTAMRARQEREEQELQEEAQAHKLGLQARLLRLDVGERSKQARQRRSGDPDDTHQGLEQAGRARRAR